MHQHFQGALGDRQVYNEILRYAHPPATGPSAIPDGMVDRLTRNAAAAEEKRAAEFEAAIERGRRETDVVDRMIQGYRPRKNAADPEERAHYRLMLRWRDMANWGDSPPKFNDSDADE